MEEYVIIKMLLVLAFSLTVVFFTWFAIFVIADLAGTSTVRGVLMLFGVYLIANLLVLQSESILLRAIIGLGPAAFGLVAYAIGWYGRIRERLEKRDGEGNGGNDG